MSKYFDSRIIQTKNGFEVWEKHPVDDIVEICDTLSEALDFVAEEEQRRKAKAPPDDGGWEEE